MGSPAKEPASSPLPPSAVTLAFASLVLLNKPLELSATEFIFYLRGCVKRDASQASHTHQLSNQTYWEKIAKDKEVKILELNQKLLDAELNNEKLAGLLKRSNDGGGEPKSKRVKNIQTGDSSLSENQLVKWEPIRKTYESILPSSENLFLILRSLHYSKDIESISSYLIKLCKTLSSKIYTLCGGDSNLHTKQNTKDSQQTRRTRQSDATALRQRLLESVWVQDVTKAIDDIFRRLFMAICKLADLTEKDKTPPVQSSLNSVTVAISDLFVSIMSSIHLTSQLFYKTDNQFPRTRDIRPGCVEVLQCFISTLNGVHRLQGSILESIIYVIVEAAGKCLCIPTPTVPTIPRKREAQAREKEALQETSIYILRLLKATLPLYREQLVNSSLQGGSNTVEKASPVLELAKKRFHEYVMRGLFGDTKTPEWKDLKPCRDGLSLESGNKSWGGVGIHDDLMFVDEEGFAEEVWKLLELEDFTLLW
ncbi:hypothetical protein TWF694_002455 [Orbilia ellipsospora]|uniref:Uncharacterized protein n=1 Tax=Orbilia ellipsospora TaxID=2528407 RepID=A0AAV9X230_9PEZI